MKAPSVLGLGLPMLPAKVSHRESEMRIKHTMDWHGNKHTEVLQFDKDDRPMYSRFNGWIFPEDVRNILASYRKTVDR